MILGCHTEGKNKAKYLSVNGILTTFIACRRNQVISKIDESRDHEYTHVFQKLTGKYQKKELEGLEVLVG